MVTGAPADSARALGNQVSTNGIAVMANPAPPITAVDAVRNLRRPLLMLSSAISLSALLVVATLERVAVVLPDAHGTDERPAAAAVPSSIGPQNRVSLAFAS